jgi:hypothetical protein
MDMDDPLQSQGIAMSPTYKTSERLLNIYLALGQYPILRDRVRALMREELFERGIIDRQDFEARVHAAAIQSQKREGLVTPQEEEPEENWQKRLDNVRDQLTDIMFSLQLPYEEFELLLSRALSERGVPEEDLTLAINPELASRDLVFRQARMIENMPPDERRAYQPRLEESKVVIIRSMISDQLRYVNIAKDWFTVAELEDIRKRKIGAGRIGGKAAGMLLAYHLLNKSAEIPLKECLRLPESYFIGATEFYPFMSINNLTHWLDQKYKTEEEMRADYPRIVADFEAGQFPPDIAEKVDVLLKKVGKQPLIVRSSSLLEDNFGTAFAGKYESIYLPNQGTDAENRAALTRGIAHVYASGLNPDALLYRRQKGLLDYDERMAILVQVVEGEQFGHFYLPHGAGVAFSRNTFRWAPQIHSEDGFVRLVWGFGTRAVERVGNDFPRLVALSHPMLRPSSDPKDVRRYSQHFVDLIDLEQNRFVTLPVRDVLTQRYEPLRYIAQVDSGGYFSSLRSRMVAGDVDRLVITFDELLSRTSFAERMREMLQLLEHAYQEPVDMEFTIHIHPQPSGDPKLTITILQCRPQSRLMETERAVIPLNLQPQKVVFSTHFVVPQGLIEHVDYVVFVPPEAYFALPSEASRTKLARTIGQLNAAMEGKKFILIGPGRFGSSNTDLGIPVNYGDIYNARSLVEMAGEGIVPDLEPSLGTHFFQDLMEAQIYPLGILMDDPANVFNQEFFYKTPNRIGDWLKVSPDLQEALHLIKVSDYRPGHHVRIVMDSEETHAVAYLERDN